MRLILSFAASFLATMSLSADSISNVEFSIPAPIHAKGWKVTPRQDVKEGAIQAQTFLYLPDDYTPNGEPPIESFVASANNLPNSGLTKEMLTQLLSNQAPAGQTVDVKVIKQSGDSSLYEWSAKDANAETAHGYIRIFSNSKGSVMLGYMNLKPDTIKSVSAAWQKALGEAKEVAK